jgi:cytochrome c oxidase assembly factor CtaG/polyferredoxin
VTPALDAALRSWPADPWLAAGLLLTAVVYLRGWLVFRRRDPARWPIARPAAFLGGLAAIFLALASPVEPFASLLLQVHMGQHFLLTMAAPPLIWLGHPLLPMVRGLPEPIRIYWVAPLFGVRRLRRLAGWLVRPATAWVLFIAATWAWHFPALYDLALRDPRWHYVQHLCFLGSGLLFWFPVVRPYPYRPAWPTWVLLPYLLLADVSNTVLSALLAFSDRVLYPHYLEVPRLGSGTPLDDQAVAGVLMWVPGSVAFLLPLAVIGVKLLFAEEPPRKPQRISLPLAGGAGGRSGRFDLLRVPVLGRFLRWRYARPALQLPLLLLAIVVVWDGFAGPPDAPRNLAGVLPWVHWRGLLVLGLLVAGNVFCTACPFMLPRTMARKFLPAGRAWPRRLRSKWLAVALLVAFFTAYEAFALWDRPAVTAWIVVGYFVGAFAVDGLFRGAAFCKYVCPVGQFNFVQSLASPMTVAVRDHAVCAACKTKDCVKACELGLNVPRKADNLDCTLCLDCVHACPYDNIGLLPRPEPKPSPRPDLTALVLVLVFAAFANAAGMTGPVLDWYERLAGDTGLSPRTVVVLAGVLALTAVPSAAVGTTTVLSRRWGRLPIGGVELAGRFAATFVPLGFAMWLAHYGYHLLTSYESAWPVVQRFAADHALNLGTPEWARACCRPVGAWLPKLEILFLDVGLLATLHAMYRVARELAPTRAVAVLLPWAALAVGLFAAGVWVVLQPMDMRGTLGPAG